MHEINIFMEVHVYIRQLFFKEHIRYKKPQIFETSILCLK